MGTRTYSKEKGRLFRKVNKISLWLTKEIIGRPGAHQERGSALQLNGTKNEKNSRAGNTGHCFAILQEE